MLGDGMGKKEDETDLKLFPDERRENNRYAKVRTGVNESEWVRKTGKCQEEDKDNSICLSIEKNLPNANMKLIIEEFQKEIKMKNRAVEVAESLIKKITEQNKELYRKIQQLNDALSRKENEMEALNLRFNCKQQSCSKCSKGCRRANSFEEENNGRASPEWERRQGRHSDLKIINIDHPQYKDLSLSKLNVSKKLVPIQYSNASIRSSHSLNSWQGQFECSGLLQEMAILMVKEEMDASSALVRDMQGLLQEEDIAYADMCDGLNCKHQEIDHEICTPDQHAVQKKLFEEYDCIQDEDALQHSISHLIKEYQKCIANFRQYCNLIRSLLCQCINFVGQKMAIELPPSFVDPAFLPHLLKVVTRDVKERIFCKTKDMLQLRNELKEENEELKQLIEEMIKHYERSKREDQYDQSINYKGMKQLQ